MEKKAKIIATLGPSIYSEDKLKKIINLGVDAFRVNFSHETKDIGKIISKIRKIEKFKRKHIAIIADIQGIKLRIGKLNKKNIRIKYNQKYIFDNDSKLGDNNRVKFPYPKILKKIKKGYKILLDDGKYIFVVVGKKKNQIITKCKSQ